MNSGAGTTAPSYRPDIDGLRAIAIITVVLFHFGIPGFSGGYVGVDVFFVISGYLITSLIRSEMEQGSFSVIRFYERRVRRLLPALFVMLAATCGLALWLLMPADLIQFGRSLAATALFGSNLFFWRNIGYFDPGGATRPLLHTWSLGVEEQFYIFFPIMLWLLKGHRRWVAAVAVAVLAFISLAASQWAAIERPNGAFFFTPLRVWEPFLGALLALAQFKLPRRSFPIQALGFIGLAMVLLPVFLYSDRTPFPGVAAAVPCLGAAMLIYTGADGRSAIGQTLSGRPFVAVGLISYSLYLWHWPLLVFGNYYEPLGMALAQKMLALCVSVILAALSWRFIERPFRQGFLTRGWLFAGAALLICAAIGVRIAIVEMEGAPSRLSPRIERVFPATEAVRNMMTCPHKANPSGRASVKCDVGAPGVPPSFFVWGDSYAMALMPAFDQAGRAEGQAGLISSITSGCAPLEGVVRPHSRGCPEFIAAQFAAISDPAIQKVFLVCRWGMLAEGTYYDGEGTRRVVLTDGKSLSKLNNHAVFAAGLERTIRTLRAAGKTVILVHATPESEFNVPKALVRAEIVQQPVELGPSLEEYLERQAFVMRTAEALGQKYGLRVISPHRELCRNGRCRVELDGRALYRDQSHFSVLGAEQLIGLVADALTTP